MKQKLISQLNNDLSKIENYKEKRFFLETINFAASADENDFKNYYSEKFISESDFYSVIDILYSLDNLCMLEYFLKKNGDRFSYEDYCNNAPFCDITDENAENIIKRYFKLKEEKKI